MGSSHAGEMCLESGRAATARRGKKAAGAAEQKAAKQPQRGLGVAQLEKIRLHNQMIAAYRSGLHAPPQQQQQVPFAAPMASAGPMPMTGGVSSFQPYLTDCFEATDRGIIDVQYYCENLLPYSSSRPPATRPPPPVFVHDVVKDSSDKRLGHYYWMSSSHESSGRSSAGSTEELDLELRL